MPLEITEPTRLYTVNEASQVFGVSRVTLWKAIDRGKLPVLRYAKWVFIKEPDFLRWFANEYRADKVTRRGKRSKSRRQRK